MPPVISFQNTITLRFRPRLPSKAWPAIYRRRRAIPARVAIRPGPLKTLEEPGLTGGIVDEDDRHLRRTCHVIGQFIWRSLAPGPSGLSTRIDRAPNRTLSLVGRGPPAVRNYLESDVRVPHGWWVSRPPHPALRATFSPQGGRRRKARGPRTAWSGGTATPLAPLVALTLRVRRSITRSVMTTASGERTRALGCIVG